MLSEGKFFVDIRGIFKMGKENLVMKPQAWLLGTLVSAITMISYVHAFVFTRTEAEKLERSVEKVEVKVDRIEKDIRTELRSINEWLRAERARGESRNR